MYLVEVVGKIGDGALSRCSPPSFSVQLLHLEQTTWTSK